MKLYITRHGKTVWNTEKRLQGWKDSPLTEEGKKKAEVLKGILDGVDFDIVYASDQNRAVKTAEILLANRNISLKTLPELREIGFGKWEGMILEDIQREYPEDYEDYLNRPLEYKPYGGETIRDLFKRVGKFLSSIEKSGHDNILIVSHGVTIRALVTILENGNIEDMAHIPVYPGTSLTVYKKNGDLWEPEIKADTTYLDEICIK